MRSTARIETFVVGVRTVDQLLLRKRLESLVDQLPNRVEKNCPVALRPVPIPNDGESIPLVIYAHLTICAANFGVVLRRH